MWRRFASRRSLEDIARRKAEIVERYGEWTAHNIQLADGLYTRAPEPCGDEAKLRCAVQLIADTTGRPFSDLRIADLGCLEGIYAAEFGLRGSEVLGIEGREANIAKAVFACETLGLSRVRFVQDDVRNFSREKYGSFDAVLCWGLLYHLNAPDVFEFLDNLAGACRCCAVIDTQISLGDKELAELPKEAFWRHPKEFQSELSSFTYRGRKYWGRGVPEHDPATTPEQRVESKWASLDNVTSFWLTFESLVNALMDAGFTSVVKCWAPVLPGYPVDRVTIVALRSEPSGALRVTPQGAEDGPWRLLERSAPTTDPDGRRVAFAAGSELQFAAARRGWLLEHLELILATVEAPDHREDDPMPGREWFYRQNVLEPARWLGVAVDFHNDPGWIVTVLVQDNDPCGRQ